MAIQGATVEENQHNLQEAFQPCQQGLARSLFEADE